MTTISDRIDEVLARTETDLEANLARLFDLIRIPSVSTDLAHQADCRRAAQWLTNDLEAAGFKARLHDTAGHPMVVGHRRTGKRPHVLFYGHYDVQPVDPLNLWQSDPFEPCLKPLPDGDTAIVGRGASDDKGQLMTFVEACRAWIAVTGDLPIDVTMLFEGEEESGSASLAPFLDKTASELAADLVLVCDTDMWDHDRPAITTMLRGLVAQEIEISCADRDLHSGMFGNAARNALQVMGDVIASLRHPDGSCAIAGFYDGVEPPSDNLRARWQRLPFDEKAFLGDIGLQIPAGEQAYPVLEQVWARPSCEINGLWGGYMEEGFKTVIPARAHAKISFRLVAGQDPDAVRAAFQAHVQAHIPADCTVSFKDHGLSPAVTMPVNSPAMNACLAALSEEWQTEAAVAGTGGTIPIIGELQRRIGTNALLIGFARFDNRIHSPNEKYDLSSYRKGIRSWVRILAALADGA